LSSDLNDFKLLGGIGALSAGGVDGGGGRSNGARGAGGGATYKRENM